MGKCNECQLPGGDKNFHICLDLKAPMNLSPGYLEARDRSFRHEFTPVHRANLKKAALQRWARFRESNQIATNGERLKVRPGVIPNRIR